MGDKSIIWEAGNKIANGRCLMDSSYSVLVDNPYATNMVIDSISGYIEMAPTTSSKFYYWIIGIADADNQFPFDSGSRSAVTTNAQLQSYLTKHKDKIWMSLGGLALTGDTATERTKIEFDAKSKRALTKGEKLVLVGFCANWNNTSAGDMWYTVDMTAFYH